MKKKKDYLIILGNKIGLGERKVINFNIAKLYTATDV
ncbi:MAG: hypothetical protein ACJAWO_002540, partial [Halieaceae bacterium]